jgi:hypothetical protein
MATRSLGTLTLDLVAKIGGFTQGMDQASRIADKRMRAIEQRANAFGRTLGSSIKSAGAQFLAFAGVTVTIGAALDGLKGAIDRADELRDLSIRLGTSTETLSAFGYAAAQTGTDMDALSKGMKILAKNAADAQNSTSEQAKVFAALGISVTDSAGNLKQLGDLIPEIADKFKGLEDGTTKAALAQALFGKSGLELTEFLNAGSDGLQEFSDKAAKLGIIVGKDAADAADKFNDDLNDLKTAAQGLALEVAQSLLPHLDKLVTWATDFVSDGANAEEAARGIADGFREMGEALNSLSQLVGVLENIHDFLASSDKLAQSFANFTGAAKFGEALKRNLPFLYASPGSSKASSSTFTGPNALQIPVLNGGGAFNATSGQFNATAGVGRSAPVDAKAIALALSNPSATKHTGGGRSGKSDAEREAERVTRAIEQMTQAQQAWQDEVAKTGNPIADEYAGRLREIADEAKDFAKDGVPAEKVKEFTDQMTALATSLRDADIAKFQKEFNDQTAEMAAQMQGPAAEALQRYKEDVSDLDDLLKDGSITLEQYNARLAELGQVRDAPMNDVIGALQEQLRLLGMTNEQQEIYNNLKQAGVKADSDSGAQITALTEQLQAQREALREQVEVMDAARDAAGTFFEDLNEGKGIWDSLKDAAGQFADTLLRIAQQRLIEQIFGQAGTAGPSGSSGTGWGGLFSSLISSLFGGGSSGFGGEGSPLANGGWTSPNKVHQVGEYDAPELLLRNGKQYLLPGDRGRVVPMGGGGGGGPMYFQFNVPGRVTRETGTQAGQRAAKELRMASRNS